MSTIPGGHQHAGQARVEGMPGHAPSQVGDGTGGVEGVQVAE